MALLFDTRLTGGLAGKSAYEYAQEGGYKGTEADFTESLGDMGDIGITLTTTLPSGESSLTLTDERIAADSTLNAVYTSKFGMSVKSAVFEDGSLTIEFPSQDEDVDIKVVINANLALGGNGIGIESIEQTVTSTEDNGDNVITVTMTDGSSETFTVKNGSQGSQGEKGETGEQGIQGEQGVQGKSAYDYAVDGGYEGTETEFMALMGGLGAYEGESSWELVGNVISNNEINLPLEWEELKVVTILGNHKFESTLLKSEYDTHFESNTALTLVDSGIPENISGGYYKGIHWLLTETSVNVSKFVNGNVVNTTNDYATTYLYYKKKSPITVNVGTESNWELWGEYTDCNGGNYKALPTDWEEIKLVAIKNVSSSGHINVETINKETFEEMKTITGSTNYITLESKSVSFLIRPNYNDVVLSTTGYIVQIYYKKKCDNVLDVNDLGEWKEVGTNYGTNQVTIPSDFKELLVICSNTQYPTIYNGVISKKTLIYGSNNTTSNTFYVSIGPSTSVAISKDFTTICLYKIEDVSATLTTTNLKYEVYYR